jgi:PAS domain S-box-containing protein
MQGNAQECRLLFEANPNPMWIFDEATLRFLEVNEAAVRLYGWSREEFLGMTVKAIRPPEEVPTLIAGLAAQRGSKVFFAGERHHWKKDRTLLDVEVTISCVQFRGRDARLTMVNDVTERKRAKEALQASEERFRALVQASSDVVYRMSADWREMRHLVGRVFVADTEEPSRTWLRNYIHPDDQPQVTTVINKAIRTKSVFELEHRVRRVDGSLGWAFSRAIPILDAEGKIVEWLGMASDVTARKEAEMALQTDVSATKLLAELGRISTREDDLKPVLTAVVDTAIVTTGADFGNIQLLDPASGDLKIAAQRGFPRWWIKFWDHVSKGQGVCGTALERGTRVIVEDVEKCEVFAGTSALKMQLKAGVRAVQSTPLISRSGKLLGMFSTHYKMPHRPNERALSLLDLLARQAADLIERAQAEVALQASEQRLALAASGARIGLFEWSISTGNTLWTEQCARLLGFRTTTMATTSTTLSLKYHYRDWVRRVHREDLPLVEAETRRCIFQHRPFEMEYRVIWPNKTEHWLAARAIFLYDEKGKAERMLGILLDVTERKQAEELLKKLNTTLENRVAERTQELTLANQRLQAVMDTALIGILTLDNRGLIKSVNPAAARIFGYAPQGMLEEEVSRLIGAPSQRQDESFLSHFLQSSRKQGLGAVGEVFGQHKDGHAMVLEFSLAEFPERGGGRFVAMVRDITLRKRLERELLDVGERERQRLGHDLHDGLGQHLHALYYMASLLAKEMKAAAPDQAHEASRLAQQLEHGLELTRSLARGLQPVSVVPEGLMVALRDLAERTRALYRVDCRFQCAPPVLIQRHAAANHLYRIAQEAVNNAMKHGNPTRLRIRLADVRERVILGIHDNGGGIRRQATGSPGMGLKVMQFRADAIQGSLVVQRHPQGGTEVVCSVNREALITPEEQQT